MDAVLEAGDIHSSLVKIISSSGICSGVHCGIRDPRYLLDQHLEINTACLNMRNGKFYVLRHVEPRSSGFRCTSAVPIVEFSFIVYVTYRQGAWWTFSWLMRVGRSMVGSVSMKIFVPMVMQLTFLSFAFSGIRCSCCFRFKQFLNKFRERRT